MPAVPDSLVRVRKEAADALLTSLNALAAAADDKFFDLSQNAPADEQAVYFEAMKELRVRRQALVDETAHGFGADFDTLVAPPAAARPAGKGPAISLDSLSLLGDDDLDVSVAVQGMAARVRDILANDLDHLRQRVAKVLAREELEAERLPLHPARLSEHFRAAVEKATLPLKARLILYKLFERTVLEDLHDLVAHANQTLVQAGVLPEIKSARPRALRSPEGRGGDRDRRRRARGEDGDAADEAPGVSVEAEAMAGLYALARQAMAARGGLALPAPGTASLPLQELPAGQLPVMQDGRLMFGGAVVQSDVPVQVIPAAELTALLTRLQQALPQATPPGQVIDHAEVVDVKGGLSSLVEDTGGTSARALNGADDDVINLVSMLFDLILDDTELPTEIKALIGRLQIPMLKVALLDKTLFGEDHHPARRLLNALARAGIGWTREADDGLYARIEQVIYTILNEFTDDLTLFDRLEDSFTAFVAERDKRMALVETRLRDREEGQARTEVAQREVREVVATRLAGRLLPPEAVAVVQDAWQRVLYMTAIRDGTASELWQQRVKVLEVLVWTVQKHERADAQEKQRLLAPRLLVSLRKGFAETGFDAARGEEMISGLARVLRELTAGGRIERALKVTAEPVAPARSATAVDAVQVLRRTDDEVVIAAPLPEAPAPGVDPRWLDMADHLAPGAWIEFSEPDFKLRGKIAARLRAQNKYVFVNGRGVKIAEKTVEQLARDFEAGVARLVSDAAVFDRALESMIGRLKSAQATPG